MGDTYFAMFDEDVRRLKVVRMSQIIPDPCLVLKLSPYTNLTSTDSVRVAVSEQPEPMLKRIPLDAEKHVYLWRSPWCMYNKDYNSWIPILDSDQRDTIPGQFTYHTEYKLYNPWRAEYNKLRARMLLSATAIEREYQEQQSMLRSPAPVPVPLPAAVPVRAPKPMPVPAPLPSRKPPAYVAEIIKRDAIANRLSCMISLEDITENMKTEVTPCFHIFEAASLSKWIALKSVCPACIAPITQDDCLLL